MTSILRVPVSEKAVCQRVNRKLRAEGQALKRSRGRYAAELGDYYILDVQRSCVLRLNVGLEEFARALGALQEFEGLEQDRAR